MSLQASSPLGYFVVGYQFMKYKVQWEVICFDLNISMQKGALARDYAFESLGRPESLGTL